MANNSVPLERTEERLALIAEGRDPKRGVFVKGNTLGGRRKGSRNKLTQEMLDRVANGVSPSEILLEIMLDEKANPELRAKCAMRVGDWLHPKASSIEVTIDDKDKYTKTQLEDRIKTLVAENAKQGADTEES